MNALVIVLITLSIIGGCIFLYAIFSHDVTHRIVKEGAFYYPERKVVEDNIVMWYKINNTTGLTEYVSFSTFYEAELYTKVLKRNEKTKSQKVIRYY